MQWTSIPSIVGVFVYVGGRGGRVKILLHATETPGGD